MGENIKINRYNNQTHLIQPGTLPNIYIGRQPIFDRYMRVMGYELLYREANCDHAQFDDPDQATSHVILNTFAEIGLDEIVGRQKAFVNLTRNFFLEKYPIPFNPRQLVIEVPETIVLDQEIITHIKEFSQRGFLIALDDVVSLDNIREIANMADIIKIDLSLIPQEKILPLAYSLQFHKAKLLAEKVETKEQLDFCLRAGFDYFQGYFLSKPNLVSSRQIPTSKIVLLQLLAKLQNPDVGFHELEYLIAEDAVLGYKLLRLTNSAYYGLRSEVKSIRQAMALLGIEKLRSWLTLILVADKHDKPRELTIIAMIRARMCELLAISTNLPAPDSYFLAGLLSALDIIMDIPLEQLLLNIKITQEIKDALMERKGNIGKALDCVVGYENAEWEKVNFFKHGFEDIRDIYLKSLIWVESMRRALNIN
ncbi:MAG: EAL and HDOD domain-containing protein [Anaerolineales bacterium]